MSAAALKKILHRFTDPRVGHAAVGEVTRTNCLSLRLGPRRWGLLLAADFSETRTWSLMNAQVLLLAPKKTVIGNGHVLGFLIEK